VGELLFQDITALHIENYYNGDDMASSRKSDLQLALFDVQVDIVVLRMDPPYVEIIDVAVDEEVDEKNGGNGNGGGNGIGNGNGSGNGNGNGADRMRTLVVLRTTPQQKETHRRYLRSSRRNQEAGVLTISYSQTISYRIRDNANIDESDVDSIINSIAMEPFDNISKRGRFVASLKNGGNGFFDTLMFATLPTIKKEEVVPAETSKRLDMWVIVGSVVGGLVIIFIMGILYLRWRRDQIYKAPPESEFRIELPVIDDSGTLNTDPNGGNLSPESIAGFGSNGQDRSVGTIDPDYQDDHTGTVSSAGGTIGSRTFQSHLTPGNNTFGTQSIYTNENDDDSFQNHLRSSTDQAHSRQDVFDVIAPAGKLGVVIDTPNSGAPVIHSIKEDCPIAEFLMVGDHIVAVDDENVMSYTAVKVSKMISHRSANPERKFTILRNINE